MFERLTKVLAAPMPSPLFRHVGAAGFCARTMNVCAQNLGLNIDDEDAVECRACKAGLGRMCGFTLRTLHPLRL